MRDTGKITRLMDKELSGTFMEISMKANGRETKHMATESTLIVTEPLMKECGGMTFSMGRGSNSGTIILSMRANIRKERNTG